MQADEVLLNVTYKDQANLKVKTPEWLLMV